MAKSKWLLPPEPIPPASGTRRVVSRTARLAHICPVSPVMLCPVVLSQAVLLPCVLPKALGLLLVVVPGVRVVRVGMHTLLGLQLVHGRRGVK